jgi:hypothetical protein
MSHPTSRSSRPIIQIAGDLSHCEKIAPENRLRPEVNALPHRGLLAKMHGDPMHAINRGNFGSRNIREGYFHLQSCAPDFQVISAVDDLIRHAEKSPLLEEINRETDQNANRDDMDDRLIENAFVNDGWCSHGGDKGRRTQPTAAFVQDRVFE